MEFLETEDLAESIGSTIGNAINTGVGMAHTFFSTTNFVGLGEFIATTANTAIMDTTDWGLIGETVAEGLKSGIETWYGFVTTFNFEGLGEKIGDSIKRFFREMGEVNEETGLTGWKELGVSIGTTISGFADTIVTAFEDGVNWEEIKSAVSELISGIFDNLDVNVGKLALTITAFSLFKDGSELTAAIVKKALISALVVAAEDVFGTTEAGTLAISLPAILTIAVGAIVIAWGDEIAKGIGDELLKKRADFWGKLFNVDDDTIQSVKDKAVETFNSIVDDIHPIRDFWESFTGLFNGKGPVNQKHLENVKKWLTDFVNKVKELLQGFKDWISDWSIHGKI